MNKKIVIIFLLLAVGSTVFLFYSFNKEIPNTKLENKFVELPVYLDTQDISKDLSISTDPVLKETKTDSTIVKENIKLEVPFTSQAPFGEWSDPRQENGCEEASSVMAMHWVEGKDLSAEEAKNEIIAISDWEKENYGFYEDTSIKDTAERIFMEYFKYNNVEVVYDIKVENIINELEKEHLVIVPVSGQTLNNPFFVPPGPQEHTIVIIGYDYDTKEFITNEPGTKHGEGYKYTSDTLFEAIRDYPTGYHKPISEVRKAMIVVQK